MDSRDFAATQEGDRGVLAACDFRHCGNSLESRRAEFLVAQVSSLLQVSSLVYTTTDFMSRCVVVWCAAFSLGFMEMQLSPTKPSSSASASGSCPFGIQRVIPLYWKTVVNLEYSGDLICTVHLENRGLLIRLYRLWPLCPRITTLD